MAQVGLRYLRYSKIDSEGKFTGAKTLGKAIETKVVPSTAEAKLYADDAMAESAKVVTGGTVELTVDEISDTVVSEVLGHAYSQTTKEIVRNANDIPPYIGLGRVITKMVSNAKKYKAEVLLKVQFKDSLPEEKTKGENIEFATPSLSGDFFTLDNGDWSKTATFDTLQEAQDYIDDLLAVPTAG